MTGVGEELRLERFGGGYCRSGRTVPRCNGSSLTCMASLGKLQEVKGKIERQVRSEEDGKCCLPRRHGFQLLSR